MDDRKLTHLSVTRCKTPRIGSPESRIENLAIEAQALLKRHIEESADLHNRIHTETRSYSLKKAA